MSEENKQGWVPVSLVNMAIDKFEHTIATLEAQKAALAAENERLRKACELVFGEAAKRKFLMCYPGNDFYVSLEAMQEMKNALGWDAAKEGRDAK